MKVYKIRNEEGLFSTGTSLHRPDKPPSMKFDVIGKTWTLESLQAHLKSKHMNTIFWHSITELYKNCKVVEYDLVETENEINPGQLALEQAMFDEI